MTDTQAAPADTGAEKEIAVVTIEGDGVSIRRGVDDATMSSVIALLFTGSLPKSQVGSGASMQTAGAAAGTTGVGAASKGSVNQWDPELTLGEFLETTGASTFPQKIAAAGYHLINFQKAESFSRDEVRAALVHAHEDMPANFGRDFTSAASNHLVAAMQGQSDRYYVPTTGRKAVESHFQDIPKRRTARRTRKGSSASHGEDAE